MVTGDPEAVVSPGTADVPVVMGDSEAVVVSLPVVVSPKLVVDGVRQSDGNST